MEVDTSKEKPVRPPLTETEVGIVWQLLAQLVSHCDEFTFNQEGAFTALLKKLILQQLGLKILEGHANGPYQILSWNVEKSCVAYDPPCRQRLDSFYSGLKSHVDGINPDIKILGVKYSNPALISEATNSEVVQKELVLVDLHLELKCIPLFGSKSFSKNVKPKELHADLKQVASGSSDVAICVCSVGDFSKYLTSSSQQQSTGSESDEADSSTFFSGVRPIDIQDYFTVVSRGVNTTSLARRISPGSGNSGSVIIAVVMRNSMPTNLFSGDDTEKAPDTRTESTQPSSPTKQLPPVAKSAPSGNSLSPTKSNAASPKNSPAKGKK